MVRAGAVGTHLPTSGLDIFGDLRKMNKRQVTVVRVGGAPGGRGRDGCDYGESGHPRYGSRKDSVPLLPRRALVGPGFKSAPTHVGALVRAFLP